MSDTDSDSSGSDDARERRDAYVQKMINLPNPPGLGQEFYCFVCRELGKRGQVIGFDGLLQHCNTCQTGSSSSHNSLGRLLMAASSGLFKNQTISRNPQPGLWADSERKPMPPQNRVLTNAAGIASSTPQTPKENIPTVQIIRSHVTPKNLSYASETPVQPTATFDKMPLKPDAVFGLLEQINRADEGKVQDMCEESDPPPIVNIDSKEAAAIIAETAKNLELLAERQQLMAQMLKQVEKDAKVIAANEKWLEKEFAHLVSFDTYGSNLDCDPGYLRRRLDEMEADAMEMDRAYQEATQKLTIDYCDSRNGESLVSQEILQKVVKQVKDLMELEMLVSNLENAYGIDDQDSETILF